jgi:hypothetical protein
MAKIVLLSCTKSKLDKPSQAQDLYSASPMFRKTLEYGKSLKPDKMFILSAKHHLVPMTKVLAPYDKTLKEMSADDKKKWAEETIKQMKSHSLNLDKDHFIFLTGGEYMNNIETPMEGKRMGERLQWLNSQIGKITEIFKRLKNLIHECITR